MLNNHFLGRRLPAGRHRRSPVDIANLVPSAIMALSNDKMTYRNAKVAYFCIIVCQNDIMLMGEKGTKHLNGRHRCELAN